MGREGLGWVVKGSEELGAGREGLGWVGRDWDG